MFRQLGELWPVFGGVLTKPPRGKLFYVPQRPYMTLGTLRDQLGELWPVFGGVLTKPPRGKLFYVPQRPYMTLGTLRDQMARLFYHEPQFAILDECTSAVSVDVEGQMYQYCRERGISLFTVSHRKSLWKHHDHYLQMDGRGGFVFGPIDTHTQEFGS
ncbi:hypothetical protein ACJJTC_008873 [Scirpophaga incertulas]